MRKLLVPVVCLFAGLAIACSGDGESASSNGTPTTSAPEATATRAVATATIAPTSTPEPPTATPEPPTPEPPTPEPPPPTNPPPPASNPPPANNPPPAPSGPSNASITASGLAFTTRQITARAGASVTVTLNNQDAFVPHDVVIQGVASIPMCTGPCTSSVTFTAPAARSYPFSCTIHPDMTGVMVVSP